MTGIGQNIWRNMFGTGCGFGSGIGAGIGNNYGLGYGLGMGTSSLIGNILGGVMGGCNGIGLNYAGYGGGCGTYVGCDGNVDYDAMTGAALGGLAMKFIEGGIAWGVNSARANSRASLNTDADAYKQIIDDALADLGKGVTIKDYQDVKIDEKFSKNITIEAGNVEIYTNNLSKATSELEAAQKALLTPAKGADLTALQAEVTEKQKAYDKAVADKVAAEQKLTVATQAKETEEARIQTLKNIIYNAMQEIDGVETQMAKKYSLTIGTGVFVGEDGTLQNDKGKECGRRDINTLLKTFMNTTDDKEKRLTGKFLLENTDKMDKTQLTTLAVVQRWMELNPEP